MYVIVVSVILVDAICPKDFGALSHVEDHVDDFQTQPNSYGILSQAWVWC